MNYKKDYFKIAARKYVDSGFNMKKTIMELHSGIKEKTAEVRGTRMLRNVEFKRELDTILQNIDDNTLNNKLNELLEAKHITDYKGKAKLTDLPNYSERRKTLDMIIKLCDLYPKKTTESRDLKTEFKFKVKDLNLQQLKELLGTRKVPSDKQSKETLRKNRESGNGEK